MRVREAVSEFAPQQFQSDARAEQSVTCVRGVVYISLHLKQHLIRAHQNHVLRATGLRGSDKHLNSESPPPLLQLETRTVLQWPLEYVRSNFT